MRIVPSLPRPVPWNVRIRRAAIGGAIGTIVGALLWSTGGDWWLGTAAGIVLGLFPLVINPPVIR